MNYSIDECYRLLDLQPGASLAQVKHAYKVLARVWHPDRFSNDPQLRAIADEKLKHINCARDQLVRYLANLDEHSTQKSNSNSTHDSSRPPDSKGDNSKWNDNSRDAKTSTRNPGAPVDSLWSSLAFRYGFLILSLVAGLFIFVQLRPGLRVQSRGSEPSTAASNLIPTLKLNDQVIEEITISVPYPLERMPEPVDRFSTGNKWYSGHASYTSPPGRDHEVFVVLHRLTLHAHVRISLDKACLDVLAGVTGPTEEGANKFISEHEMQSREMYISGFPAKIFRIRNRQLRESFAFDILVIQSDQKSWSFRCLFKGTTDMERISERILSSVRFH